MKATKVRWFHPDGEKMPNGVFFQRGGWLAECAENARRFAAADGAGVVVFPSGAQVEGGDKAFAGRYVSEGGIRYDSGSPTRVLEGVSGRKLLKRAAEMAEACGEPEVLVREAGGKDIWVVCPVRGGALWREESVGTAAPAAPKVRSVTLLQWMGPRSWADQAEERRVPERFEKVLREGHHAWFRVATGEGVPTSRCWMVFNEPGAWNYWRRYGVTRVLDVCPEGCRGYWSADGKQWWQVGACAPRGKRVHVRNAKAAYRAACGEMPWAVPFFDGSGKNRERLERMYAYMAGVLDRAGLEDATVSRRLETAATSRSGFSRWANRGMLYGGRFGWEKGDVW